MRFLIDNALSPWLSEKLREAGMIRLMFVIMECRQQTMKQFLTERNKNSGSSCPQTPILEDYLRNV